jgi:cobyrinic acid a,c-diamide synthase
MNIEVQKVEKYPFKSIIKKNEKCVIVYDKNFSFLYYDNLEYLKEVYCEVILVDSTKDEEIPKDIAKVFIVGGYVETQESYERVKNSNKFKNSLLKHVENKKEIYAECAGLIYLGKKIDDKKMSGILDIEFKLGKKRERLGYYKALDYDTNEVELGHAFHYSYITKAPEAKIGLYKSLKKNIKDGGYKKDNIIATYLHTMWRV